jgi:membrane protein
MFLGIYYFIPSGRLQTKMVFLSTFWASFLWLVAKELFGYYISHAALLNRIYGTYIFVVIVALWIYYSSLILIIGAEIGQLYKDRRKKEN